MKWLSLILTLAEWLIPFLAKVGKDRVAKELEIVTTGVEMFSNSESSEGKGKLVKGIIYDLAVESGIKSRLHKRIKDYETRIWRKLF